MSVFTNRILARNTEELNEIYQLINHLRNQDAAGLMLIVDFDLVSINLRNQLAAQIPALSECIERIWNACQLGDGYHDCSPEVREKILAREASRIGLDINGRVEIEGSEMVVNPPREETVA